MFVFIKLIYAKFFYNPLFNALIYLYGTIAFGDLGVAIIILTILIRLVLFPIFQRSVRHQMVMQRLQPKLKKIQDEHKGNMQKQGEAVMNLYKEHKINPFSGFLLLIIQIPILIALYNLILKSLNPDSINVLYSFISGPKEINPMFLGLINLRNPSILIVGLAAIAQYFQGRTSLGSIKASDGGKANAMMRQMVFLGPIITFLVFYRLPSAVSLYWLTTSIFSIIQQYMVNRQLQHGTLGNIPEKTG